MTKKFLFVLLMLCVASFIFATEYIDVVKTKDGNIYKGIIIENKINEYIRIELPGGTTFKVKYGDIDSILKEEAKSESSSSSIVINNTNTNTQTQNMSGGENIDPGNPYTSYELNELFGAKTLKTLKTIRIDRERMADTEEYLRYSVYDSNRKKGSGWVFLGNLLLPGVGSFFQGNTAMGFYDSLSYLGYFFSYMNYTKQEPVYDSYSGTWEQPEMDGITIALSVNMLVAYISGMVTPFTYQNSYNSELKSRLMVY